MKTQQLARLKKRRKRWLKVHLWLGLVLGLFLSIFGITGSILVFYAEIEEVLNPEMLIVAPPLDNVGYKALSEIINNGNAAMPPQAKHTFATYPRNIEAAFKLRYVLPLASGVTEQWLVAVNPYTAEVTGKQLMGSSDASLPFTLIGIVFELHYALLLGVSPGYMIVGMMGALLIISVLTGLIVWWPLTGEWLKALTIKHNASRERLNVDLHKTFGFSSALVLVPVLFSGVYMDVPKNVVPVLELFSPVTYRYWFQSKPIPSKSSITMAEAVNIVDALYPTGRINWIYGATTPTSTYTVCKDNVADVGSWLHRRCVVMDRYSGAVLDLDDPANGNAGEVFTHWQWPLHSGQAFGWTGRMLVFLSGLACPVLFVTGVIRWQQKRRAKKVSQVNRTGRWY